MNELHNYYLNLGSNIQPEINLAKAIDLLREHGEVKAVSNAWESHAIGSSGPNFLNASLLFATAVNPAELKHQVIRPIESALGRVRSRNKNAPRTLDIDIMIVDGKPVNVERWNNPFVVLPMAELVPDFIHPSARQKISQVAKQMSTQTWIIKRQGILKSSG